MKDSASEADRTPPSFLEWMEKTHRSELGRLRSCTVYTISWSEVKLAIEYMKKTFGSSWHFPAIANSQALRMSTRKDLEPFIDTLGSWKLSELKEQGHEVVAMYLLHKGYVLGIDKQWFIDPHVYGALAEILRVLYPNKEDIPL